MIMIIIIVYLFKRVIVTKLSQCCHGMVIAYRLNKHIKCIGLMLINLLEWVMELLEMRDEILIDEWADYEDDDYVDDAIEL